MHRVVIVVIGVILCIMFSGGEKKSDAPKVTDLGITIKDFQTNFNKNARERNLPQLQIDIEFIQKENEDDAFGYKFSKAFYMYGKINNDTNKVTKVDIFKAFVLNGDERQSEAKAAAAAFLIMVQTLSPSLNSEERAAILNKFSASSKPSVSVDIGNIHYSKSLIENRKVLVFSASVKD